jgi:hypothetical protein
MIHLSKDDEGPSAEQTKEYRNKTLEIIELLQEADKKMDQLMQGSFETEDKRLGDNMKTLWQELGDIVFKAKFMLLQGPEKNG